MGTFKVTEILNPILDANAEKWIFIDGRDIHTLNDFFDQIEQKLTYKIDFKTGRNLNAFNDLLWGGFGIHEYEEPLHIVWIYAEKSRQALGDKYFNKIINYIDSHYRDNDLSLELLAEKVDISVSYISAILKKEKNTTFVKYLTTLRMEKAKELLKNPNNKIVDIAESIGFSEPYYFSHSFKKYQGVSPKEYRNNEQNN